MSNHAAFSRNFVEFYRYFCHQCLVHQSSIFPPSKLHKYPVSKLHFNKCFYSSLPDETCEKPQKIDEDEQKTSVEKPRIRRRRRPIYKRYEPELGISENTANIKTDIAVGNIPGQNSSAPKQGSAAQKVRTSNLAKKFEPTYEPAPSVSENDLEVFKQEFPPSFNFSPFVNYSLTLQQLIKLGVKLHRIEEDRSLAERILKLDFENDIVPVLR